MENFTLEELPLFNGELLSVELDSTPSLSPDVDGLSSFGNPSNGPQDGSIWRGISPGEDLGQSLPKAPIIEDNHDNLVKELLFPGTGAASPVAVDQLDTDWLNSNMDLINYLESPEPELAPANLSTQPLPPAEISTGPQIVSSPFGIPPAEPGLIQTQSPPPNVQIPSPTPSVDSAGFEHGQGVPTAADMIEVLTKLSAIIDSSLEGLEEPNRNLPYEPTLSPMSVEEVESLLPLCPTSPSSSSSSDDSGFSEDLAADVSAVEPLLPTSSSIEFQSSALAIASMVTTEQDLSSVIAAQVPAPGPIKNTPKSKSSSEPYTKPSLSKEEKLKERKQRKKQQNKNAALRYRQKKKEEGSHVMSECEVLEARNVELREKVDTMTKEIDYLKCLMAEVYKAKGITLTSQQNSVSSNIATPI